MSDFIVVGILVALVVLVLVGQWLMGRRAALARGPVPDALLAYCPQAVLVFFHARGCMACRRVRPAIDRLAEANPGRVCLVDIGEHPKVAREARVIATPTLMVIESQRIVSVRLGAPGESALGELARRHGLESGDGNR